MTYPKHLYRCPGAFRQNGIAYAVAGCADEDQELALMEAGWHGTIAEAAGLSTDAGLSPDAEAKIDAAEELEDISPATRDELEQQAKALGIGFNARTSSRKLAERIAEAMNEDGA